MSALPYRFTGPVDKYRQTVLVPDNWKWVVSIEQTFPKQFGETSTAAPDIPAIDQAAEFLISAVSLQTHSPVTRGPTISLESVRWTVRNAGGSYGRGSVVTYVLDGPVGNDLDVASLATDWQSLSDSFPEIRSACRRNADSRIRTNDEDAIVDLLVALEMVLVHGARNEITFRLSLHGALLMSGNENAAYIQSFLSGAFGARSKIVHGSTGSLKLKRINGAPATMAEFRSDLEMVVRQILRKSIDQGRNFRTHMTGLLPDALSSLASQMRNP
jgi:Apea-like HEPN